MAALLPPQVTAADAGAAKPHPSPFLLAAAAAGCHPTEIVHVGDSVQSDLVGALTVGMRAVLLTRPELPPRSAAEVQAVPPESDQWRELTSLAATIEAVLGELSHL